MGLDARVHVIGGGLAGSEAAWQVARSGVAVTLHEMRPQKTTEAHKTAYFAELVCSNSFRSDDVFASAVGILHEELRRAESLIMHAADACRVPAGSALAVDREKFSRSVTRAIQENPLIHVEYGEVVDIPENWENVIIATGPLTTIEFTDMIRNLSKEPLLAFFDAIAPIVYRESINFEIAWFQSRYDKSTPGSHGADYINCPMNRRQYEEFVESIITAEKTESRDWEKLTPHFEGCLPIEVMSERGLETLRYGPMKPVGLSNPHTPSEKPYAIVQLRQDNALGTLYNMVGFQTKMKHTEQMRVFRTIPGLENAQFARFGGVHRNTFINSPRFLDPYLRCKMQPRLRFAGQITGCEGYVESTAIGLIAGKMAAAERLGQPLHLPPGTTATGALLHYLTKGHKTNDKGKKLHSFQPMNVNFGLFPPIGTCPQSIDGKKRMDRIAESRRAIAERAIAHFSTWIDRMNGNSKAVAST